MVVATIMMMVGCTGNGGTQQEEQPQDTVYTQEAAMKVYDYDPVRALRIVDSAVIVGNLSDWRADKNRARIYSQTRLRERLDSLMHWPADKREDYIRFYRTQAENFIATAYSDLGKTDDMQATFERLENIIIDAEAREHLARYRALEQKMQSERQRLEMEAQAQRNLYFAVIVCILLAVALAALAWYFRQMRIVRQKNRALVRQIDEVLRYKELFHEGNTHAVDTAANLKSSGAFKNLSEIVCKSVCAIAGADFFVYLRSQ